MKRRFSARPFRAGGDEYVVFSFPAAAPSPRAALTEAEWTVARAILRGRSNREIALERGTSQRTVANQIASIFQKLDVHSRSELTALLAEEE